MRPLRKWVCVLASSVLTVAAEARGQAEAAALDFRIVPQDGVLPGTITDRSGGLTEHRPIENLVDATRRFELQFRLRDLIAEDGIVVQSFAVATINIRMTKGGVNGFMSKARLSRFEAQLAEDTPPTTTDASGSPTGAFSAATGVHRPYRGAFDPTPVNSSAAANGTVGPDGITGIVALRQGSSGLPTSEDWFGLYSFEFTATGGAGEVEFAASCELDVGLNARFGYFANDQAASWNLSANSGVGVASVQVVPAPVAGWLAVLAVGARPRRRSMRRRAD